MFRNTKAFSGFAVDDLEAARKFYSGTLGLGISFHPFCRMLEWRSAEDPASAEDPVSRGVPKSPRRPEPPR